jgi:hypothetical protein
MPLEVGKAADVVMGDAVAGPPYAEGGPVGMGMAVARAAAETVAYRRGI